MPLENKPYRGRNQECALYLCASSSESELHETGAGLGKKARQRRGVYPFEKNTRQRRKRSRKEKTAEAQTLSV